MRFPSFTSGLINSTISREFILSSGSTPSTKEISLFKNGKYNWANSGELNSIYLTNTKNKITDLALTNSNLKIYPLGTLVIAIYGLEAKGVRGKASLLGIESTISQSCMAFESKGNVTNKFMYHFYKKHSETLGIKYAQGTKQQNLSSDLLGSYKLQYPSIKEQNYITDFLAVIEERIYTQNKIISEKIVLKKIIIEKLLYAKETKTIKLMELADLKNGYAFQSSSYTKNGKYNIVTIKSVTGKRKINVETCNTINVLPNDIQKHQIINKDAILISMTGNVGRVSLSSEENCLLNQRVGLLETTDIKLKEYIYQVLSNKKFETKMTMKGQGAAQLNISKEDILSYEIPILSNYSDILYISKLLKTIDDEIITEEKLLTFYQSQKKYMLNNLFI